VREAKVYLKFLDISECLKVTLSVLEPTFFVHQPRELPCLGTHFTTKVYLRPDGLATFTHELSEKDYEELVKKKRVHVYPIQLDFLSVLFPTS
jgi:hypothetical protein